MEEHTLNILNKFKKDVESIDISGLGIKGKLDLLCYKHLKELRCQNNQITKITYLNPELNYLDCSNNLIEYIGDVPNHLSYFNCENNPITTLMFDSNPIISYVLSNKSVIVDNDLHINLLERLKNLPIKKLGLGYYYNQSVKRLPKTITHLEFGYKFNLSIKSLKSNTSITNLTLDHDFNHNINSLPKNLTNLTINAGKFSKSLDNLPNTITHLTLGLNFNSVIDNLPNSITHLTLGKKFNRLIDKLPNSITHLEFTSGNDKYDIPSSFTQPLDNLPNSIIYLVLPDSYNIELTSLPNHIKYLEIGGEYEQSINALPDSIEEIIINHKTARDEMDGKFYGTNIGNLHKIHVSNLPKNLKSIRYATGPIITPDSKYTILEKFNAYNKIECNNKFIFDLDFKVENNNSEETKNKLTIQKKSLISENKILGNKYGFKIFNYDFESEDKSYNNFEDITNDEYEVKKYYVHDYGSDHDIEFESYSEKYCYTDFIRNH